MFTSCNSDITIKKSIAILREEAKSALIGFHAAPLSRSNWNLVMLVLRREENRKKNLEERREPTTNYT